ncbi:RHS repeat-associated core domain-containing protein [Ramlibacter sp.]|uniref:RHS repeat-associated core domain-containing protein n=1 Tax=Ramlibacter sp. TaxID=1917967 RepID=UPI0035B26CFE
MCEIAGRTQCIAPRLVQGIQAALPEHCAQYAADHTARGGFVGCWTSGSTNTMCQLRDPAVSPGFVGAKWATTNIRMAGVDINAFDYGPPRGPVYETWGPNDYAGPVCQCPANSMIQSDASCRCPAGMNWDPEQQKCAVRIDPTVIALFGNNRTKALPVGPALPMEAKVTKAGEPQPDIVVTIHGPGGPFQGVTDGGGSFKFMYVPPVLKAARETLTATCHGCVNEATKTITVEMCLTCDPAFGNPIQPGRGEKQQDETDWVDAAAHPLTFTRIFRSSGAAASTFGATWSHAFAARMIISATTADVELPDGRTLAFTQENGQWVAAGHNDRLVVQGDQFVFSQISTDRTFTFNGQGQLLALTERNGWAMTLTWGADFRLQRVTNAFGRSLQFTHDANGRLVSIATPDGQTLQYAYTQSQTPQLLSVTHPGGTRTYHYEDARFPSLLTGITNEAQVRIATYAYDSAGRAIGTVHIGQTDAYSVTYSGSGSASGTLQAGTTVDPSIYSLTTTVTTPNGAVQRLTWVGAADGWVYRASASQALDGDTLASRALGADGMPQVETDFNGVRREHAWDARRRLKTQTTEAAGLPEQRTTATEWHPQWRLPVRVSEPGRTTVNTYDASGNLLSEQITDVATGQVRTRSWTYNARGQVETMTLPGGGVWTYGYDAAGNTVSLRDPLQRQTTFTHDAGGRVLTRTEPGGLTSTYTYDARGRLLTATVGGETTTYAYTATGQLQSTTLPNGHQVSYTYDQADRLIAAQDNRGASLSYTLDASGNRTREELRDASGAIAAVTQRGIDALGRVTATANSIGQTTRYGHDANGVPVSETDPLNQTTRQTLDALGRPVATTFADSAAATQAFNALDALTQVTDPKGVTTRYATNAFGEVMSETSPDIGTISYQRDANGEVTRIEDARGQITTIERDALGRIQRIAYADGQQVTYTYDAAGYLARLEDAAGVSVFTRDALGRVLSKTQDVNDTPTAPSRFRVAYTWHPGGAVASITYPSGAKVSYDVTAGRVSAVRVWNGKKNQPEVPFLSGLTYTALGQPRAWNWFNGDTASRTFDTDGRMTANDFASYTWDPAGRITRISQSLTAEGSGTVYLTSLSWQAGYDSRNRLTSFSRPGSDSRYTYDANSNRLTGIEQATSDTDLDGEFDATDRSRLTAQAMNLDAASNRLLGFTQTLTTLNNGKTKSVVVSPVTYSVDANGALTGDGLRTFEYDGANRLKRIRAPLDGESAVVSYLTNGLGQRVFRSEPTAEQTLPNQQTLGVDFITWLKKQFGWLFTQAAANTSIGTAYLYADAGVIPSWAILGEYDNGSATGKGRTEYIWLPTEDGTGIPVGIIRNGKLYGIHTDHLGTPRVMKNEANEVVWQWPYSAFGQNKPTGVLKATPNPNQAITNQPVLLKATNPTELNLRFPGQYAEDAGGVVYNYFRNYDPRVGRYTQADPIGLAGGLESVRVCGRAPHRSSGPVWA